MSCNHRCRMRFSASSGSSVRAEAPQALSRARDQEGNGEVRKQLRKRERMTVLSQVRGKFFAGENVLPWLKRSGRRQFQGGVMPNAQAAGGLDAIGQPHQKPRYGDQGARRAEP